MNSTHRSEMRWTIAALAAATLAIAVAPQCTSRSLPADPGVPPNRRADEEAAPKPVLQPVIPDVVPLDADDAESYYEEPGC